MRRQLSELRCLHVILSNIRVPGGGQACRTAAIDLTAVTMERNGKSSSGKRTRHLNIRFFCITDLLEKQEFEVEHCPTEDMQADFLTKPLQGETFKKMFKWLMGIE